ncbi:cytochrome P450 9e2-like [Harmonia axyridis]|uniref:cytochrome P450 9e2-like n=1 Tax=Harmonia axyridis TaxID=115357 RepID=UPI001E2782C0|nr:cytochrome P450 9e2-like [Harmonia axyridis]
MMLLLLVILLILIIIGHLLTTLVPAYYYWKIRGVPHVSLLTVLKRMIMKDKPYFDLVISDHNKFAGKRYYGSYMSVMPALFIRDLDLIKKILIKDFEHFTNRLDILNASSDPIFRNNLLVAKGKKWKALRSTISPVFTTAKMKAMYVLIAEEAKKFVVYYNSMNQDEIEVEMKEMYSKFTNDVIASCSFGVQIDSLKDPKNDMFLAGKVITQTTPFNVAWILISMLFPKLLKYLKVNIFPTQITQYFKNMISATIRSREEGKITRPDLIQLLVEAKKGKLKRENTPQAEETGFATVRESTDLQVDSSLEITDEIIVAQAIIFFLAGFEASSSLLSCLSYELALNPRIQQKLIEEIDEHLASSDIITYEMITKMKYLDQVVSEALRKWPTAFLQLRICTKDYVIEPEEELEVPLKVSKGSLVVIPIIGTHYDERYFENPDAFIPERFSDGENIVPQSFAPFGIGPRNCVGSRFALLEIKCILANILSKFEMQITKKTNIPFKKLNTIPFAIDGGITLALKKRKNTSL